MTCPVMSPTRFQLREYLEEAEIGQSELARKSGVSFATVNRLCQNTTSQVSLETLDRLAKALSDVLKRKVVAGDLLKTTVR